MSVEDYDFVPLYDIKTVSGQKAFAEGAQPGKSLAFPRGWLIEHVGAEARDLALIHMYGDEMKPALNNGDLLFVNRAATVVTKGIYAFFLDGFLFVQRLQRSGAEIYALSEDGKLPPSLLPDFEGFEERSGIVGRVVWAGSEL